MYPSIFHRNISVLSIAVTFFLTGCDDKNLSSSDYRGEGGDRYTPEPYCDTSTGIIKVNSSEFKNGDVVYFFEWYYTSDTSKLNPYEADLYFDHDINVKQRLLPGIYFGRKIEKGYWKGSRGPQEESAEFTINYFK